MSSSENGTFTSSELAWLAHMLRRVAPTVRNEQDILLRLIRKIEHELQQAKPN
jgi:hypothetical protein